MQDEHERREEDGGTRDGRTLEDALATVRDLRARDAWDKAQTHDSLRPYLNEEMHELDDAIRSGDDAAMRSELGDVLLQVLFHAIIAEERGAFDVSDVAGSLVHKMEARHPWLYEGRVPSADGLESAAESREGQHVPAERREPWEKMKARLRSSLADGLPRGLPSLHRAHRLQERAAGVGFDWPDVRGPAAKVREELAEVEAVIGEHGAEFETHGVPSGDPRHAMLERELGDLLFAVVNLCRKAGVHPALALDKANQTFESRFAKIEELATARGIDVRTAGLERLDALWDEAKRAE